MQERFRWISVFFRKNLFTIICLVGFLIILFVIINPFHSMQSSDENSLQTLKKENNQLKQEIKSLSQKQETEKAFYTYKINELNQAKHSAEYMGGEYLLLMSTLKKEIKDDLYPVGIFVPEHTKKGDKIAGLIVSDVKKGSGQSVTNYYVDFTGEFTVKGSIYHIGESGYLFDVEENKKLPHTFGQWPRVNFTIKNENELIKALGEKVKNTTDSNRIRMEGVFKNLSFNDIPDTGGNSAEFVRLISQN